MQNLISNPLLLSMPGGSEWILILIVVLLMFGGKKIPDLMRGVGKGMREFKEAKDNVTSEIEKGMQVAPQQEAKPTAVPTTVI